MDHAPEPALLALSLGEVGHRIPDMLGEVGDGILDMGEGGCERILHLATINRGMGLCAVI